MKKIIWILIFSTAIGASLWIFRDSIFTTQNAERRTQNEKYMCPMHPQIISDKPGSCPICGMTLVPVAAESKEHKHPEGTLYISPERRQLIGVTSAEVTQKSLQQEVRLPGRIAFDQELYVTESEYAEGLKLGNSDDVMQAITTKMKRLGISNEELQRLKKTKTPDSSLFMPKTNGSFWVYASLYELDLTSVVPGMKAEIRVPYDKSVLWEGEVKQITPILESETRTATARILIPSPLVGEGRVRGETYVDVVLKKDLSAVLAVPVDAVIDTGTRQIVFVDLGDGYLLPREVRIGAKAENDYAVVEGLQAGEKVVTAANFLVDSESQMKAALAGMEHHHD